MVVLITVFLYLATGYSREFYISNTGDDSNSGTSPDLPWKTLEKVNSVSQQVGDSFYFKKGDHWQGMIDVSQRNVTISSFPFSGSQQKPVISGSVVLTGWELVDQDRNLWMTHLPDNVSSIVHLFAEGRLMTIARYPNTYSRDYGLLRIDEQKTPTVLFDRTLESFENNFFVNSTMRLRRISWVWQQQKVVSSIGGELEIDVPIVMEMANGHGWGYYLDGLEAFLDVPEEWWLSSNNSVLFIPPSGIPDPNLAVVEGATWDYGIKTTMTSDNVVVDGLHLRHHGVGVYLAGTTGAHIRNNLIESPLHFGITTVNSNNFLLEQNQILGSLDNGIYVNCLLGNINGRILNNTIKDSGVVPGYCDGDGCDGIASSLIVGEVDICDNIIDGAGARCIFFLGTHNILRNVLRRAALTFNDVGIIEGVGRLVVRHNYFADTIGSLEASGCYENPVHQLVGQPYTWWHSLGRGLVVSYFPRDWIVEENVFVNTTVGLNMNDAVNVTIRNNLFFDNYIGLYFHGAASTTNAVQDNLFFMASFEQMAYWSAVSAPWNFALFGGNEYVSQTSGLLGHCMCLIPEDYTLTRWQAQGIDITATGGNFSGHSQYYFPSLGPVLNDNSDFSSSVESWSGANVQWKENCTVDIDGCASCTFDFFHLALISTPLELDANQYFRVAIRGKTSREGEVFATSIGSLFNSPFAMGNGTSHEHEFVFRTPHLVNDTGITLKISKPIWGSLPSTLWLDSVSLCTSTHVKLYDPRSMFRILYNFGTSDTSEDLHGVQYVNISGQLVAGSIVLQPGEIVLLQRKDTDGVELVEIPSVYSLGSPFVPQDWQFNSSDDFPPIIAASQWPSSNFMGLALRNAPSSPIFAVIFIQLILFVAVWLL